MSASPVLSDIPGIWRGGAPLRVEVPPTGHAGLDRMLPGGGWPVGAVSDLLHTQPGVGEMSLVLPLLEWLTQAGSRVALVNPPHVPYAPAPAQAGLHLPRLTVFAPPQEADTHWGVELLLRSGGCSAVVAWSAPSLRRLQFAAEAGRAICLLMRPLEPIAIASWS